MGNESFARNRYYITLDSYKIDPGYLQKQIQLGSGIDLSDPLAPKVRPRRAFGFPARAEAPPLDVPISGETISATFRYEESGHESQEASILSTYFKASYGFNTAEGAFEKAKQVREEYRTVYALLDHFGETEGLPEEFLHWTSEPASESVADDEEALTLFLRKYGSHYVSQIRYGLRIGIQAKLKRKDLSEEMNVSGSFRAAIGQFGAGGGAEYGEAKKLKDWGVSLSLEVTSGGRSEGEGMLVATSFEKIAQFLAQLENGEVQFCVAPVEATLDSYWESLTEWKRTQGLLKPDQGFKVPSAQYGVPPGTVLAWHPTSEYVRGLDDQGALDKVIEPPPGWAICDGTLGTPDLRGQFVMGTTTWEELGDPGGTEEHDHGVRRDDVGRSNGIVWATRKVAVSVFNKEKHVPPHVKLVYIMKLH